MTSSKETRSSTSDHGLASRVLDSLDSEIAVVDRSGEIVSVNDAWRRFALQNDAAIRDVGVGTNYLSVCKSAAGVDAGYARQAFHGIRQVLDGDRDLFTLEYPCHSPTEERWYLLHVVPLINQPGFAITAHIFDHTAQNDGEASD